MSDIYLEGTPEFNRGFQQQNGAAMDPNERHPIDKELLAMRTIEEFTGLQRAIGHEKAAREMGFALGEYVLNAELNQFEADMIGTLAILGNVATFALNENERLRDGTPGTL